MKFKKHFEDPVIFPVMLELGGNLCQTGSVIDSNEGEDMDPGNDSWE